MFFTRNSDKRNNTTLRYPIQVGNRNNTFVHKNHHFLRQQQELSPTHQVHNIIKNSQAQSGKGKGICNIKQYHSFVFKCLKGDNEESALAEVSSLLQEDKNYSLAKMAIKENKKRKVKKMTNIYITAKVSYCFPRQKKKTLKFS